MRKTIYIFNWGLVAVILMLGMYNFYLSYIRGHEEVAAKGYYTCSMHPQIREDKPGRCPICGMTLHYSEAENQKKKQTSQSENQLSHYTCPMHHQIHEDKPGNCPICGMKLIPVYKEKGDKNEVSVEVSAESQNLVGVRTTKAVRKRVTATIQTTGRVAFDPELSVAIREYLSVMNSDYDLRRGAIARLKLLGMGDEEIRSIPSRQKAYESLYLPTKSGSVWVYATAYENELAYLRPGTKAEIQNPYLKNLKFSGVIRSLSPVVDPATRSITARIEVSGAGGKLLPDSFVNVLMEVDLGMSLIIPRSAMLDSGEDQIVFIQRDKTRFVRRSVTAGPEAGDDIVILEGLEEGEEIVSSATFLIDSESRLKSAVPESE